MPLMPRASIRCCWLSAANATFRGSGRIGRPNCSRRPRRSSARGSCRWRSISSSSTGPRRPGSMPTTWSPSSPTCSPAPTGAATATSTPRPRSTRSTTRAADSTPGQNWSSRRGGRHVANSRPIYRRGCRCPMASPTRGSACRASWRSRARGSSPDRSSTRQATRRSGNRPAPARGRPTWSGSATPSAPSIRSAASRSSSSSMMPASPLHRSPTGCGSLSRGRIPRPTCTASRPSLSRSTGAAGVRS